MGEDRLLIDVRSPEEFATGGLRNAVNIPYATILDGLNTGMVTPHNTTILLYCRSGRRSAIAKSTLEQEGYTAITDLGSLEDAERALNMMDESQASKHVNVN